MEKGEAVFASVPAAAAAGPPKNSSLRHRKPVSTVAHEVVDELVEKTSTLSLKEPVKGTSAFGKYWRLLVSPVLLTALATYVRFYGIGRNQSVVWDEAHFGKFGAYYIQREYYFDVHPPLGKLLVGLSGYLAGFDGEFKFESGQPFPPGPHFFYMRWFNCIFGVLCTPLAYLTALEVGLSAWTAWYVALSVALEMLSVTLAKFILLDSFLLFFTVATFFCLSKVHGVNRSGSLLSAKGLMWLALNGLAVGCVCSVKWVGLFVTVLVGIYTVYDLLVKFYQTTVDGSAHPQTRLSVWKYLVHWAARIVCLIIIPFSIYALAFKVHFTVLSKSGTGDGSLSTLMQASLEGNTLEHGPRSLAYGSRVTLRSQGLSPNLLHSHGHVYPDGSGQQQITTYGFKDDNNVFAFEFGMETTRTQNRFATVEYDPEMPHRIIDRTTILKDGDIVRLRHKKTGCFLHSHPIAAAVSSSQYEASCYGGIHVNDPQDDWVVEIQTQEKSPSPAFDGENPDEVHPVSTNFRLRHKVVGCYLATTGHAYPSWGFNQGEVTCKRSLFASDKSTWWNIEDHVNGFLPVPEQQYVAPKPKFWKEFVMLNYGMMASNNALVPDPDHHDELESHWWEWPILRSGLRMNSWGPGAFRYYLLGHPFVTLFTTASLFGGVYVWRDSCCVATPENEFGRLLGRVELCSSRGCVPVLGSASPLFAVCFDEQSHLPSPLRTCDILCYFCFGLLG
ncbi:hypothetical protein JCM33374_g2307 [Metschnikowia sp. JCM 33374]|nr:hypothetical protein JCM33374_g2307 [Metschnikowia sp. JCM 33374]